MTLNKRQRWIVWQKQAQYDLKIAKISRERQYYEWACYQSNQAVEKMLKALISHEGKNPPRSHKLGVLIGIANHTNNAFENVKFDFRKIETFTYISRYPFIIPSTTEPPHNMISSDDADTCIRLAGDILHKIEAFIESDSRKQGKAIKTQDYYFDEDEIKTRIDDVVTKITENCTEFDLHKIILFGSFAREKTQPNTSTMDIMIIADTDMRFVERMHYVREVTRGASPIVEPVVYTPEEYQLLLDEEGEGFLESAVEEGEVIWSKDKD